MCVAFISAAAAAAAGKNPVNETTRHRTVDKPYNCRASGWNGIYLLAKLNGEGGRGDGFHGGNNDTVVGNRRYTVMNG